MLLQKGANFLKSLNANDNIDRYGYITMNAISRKRRNLMLSAAFLVLLALLVAFYGYEGRLGLPGLGSSHSNATAPVDSAQPSALNTELRAGGAGLANSSAPSLSASAADQALTKPSTLTAAEEAELTAWIKTSTGDPASELQYRSYDLATIRKLFDGGDLSLADILYSKTLRASDREAANQVFWEAAARGYTLALYSLADQLQALDYDIRSDYAPAKTAAEKQAAAIEVLALRSAAKMRNNRWLEFTFKESMSEFEARVQPSAADMQKIQTRAQEIYEQLQTQRTELGLGDFDNSTPASVIKKVEQLEK